jgi:hypothetical protein
MQTLADFRFAPEIVKDYLGLLLGIPSRNSNRLSPSAGNALVVIKISPRRAAHLVLIEYFREAISVICCIAGIGNVAQSDGGDPTTGGDADNQDSSRPLPAQAPRGFLK